MTKLPYSDNIITKTREYTQEELAWQQKYREEARIESTVTMDRLLWMDDDMVKGAEMYMECIWLWPGETKAGLMEEPHVHDFDEVIGFVGSDPDHPEDLNAVMEMHMGDEVHYLEKSCLMYLPAGMKHCPLTFKKVNKPVFFFTLAPIGNYGRTSQARDKEKYEKAPFVIPEPDETGTKYARYIITKAKPHAPSEAKAGDAPKAPPPPRDVKASHILSLDSEVIPGAFYVDFVWIWSGSMTMAPEPHTHPFDEMIGFVTHGVKSDPRGIKGDVSINIEGDDYKIDKNSLVYLPKGVKHCPIQLQNIQKPVLLFTIGNTRIWDITGGK